MEGWIGWVKALVLCGDEEFLARVQRYGRVQVPVLIRWKHKLETGERVADKVGRNWALSDFMLRNWSVKMSEIETEK